MMQTIGFNRQGSQRMRAFSLAELMVATGILGIGMIIVAMAFPVALDQSRQASELATSKLVYLDAVNKLKTKIKWTQIEAYINPAPNAGALEVNYRLGNAGIFLLSFDNVQLDPGATTTPDFFSPTVPNAMSDADCVYSADDTYGWRVAVQKISNQTYKFWIFILREPKGIASVTSLQLSRILYVSTNGKTITFNSTVVPARGEILLDDTGTLFKVTDVGEEDGSGNVTVMLDKEVQLAPAHYFTHLTGTGLTRRNPVLTVYQTVISY